MMEKENILFYDGDCAVCNRTVQFVVDHEKENTSLLFCSLQSELARQKLGPYGYDFRQMSTLVLMEGDKVSYRSTAALNLAKFFKTPYNWLGALKIFPRFIRDGVYGIIARNRHRLGKEQFCFVPDIKLKQRFVE
jgi:predicted DCC family thiol-disulfide oxidoreductase YuxK